MATTHAIISPTRYALVKPKDQKKGMTLVKVKFKDDVDLWRDGIVAIKGDGSRAFLRKIRDLAKLNAAKIEAARQANDGSLDTLVLDGLEATLNSVESTGDFDEPTIFINPRTTYTQEAADAVDALLD